MLGSTTIESFGINQLEVEVVIRPFQPAGATMPILEDLTSPGVTGYRTRLVFGQPRVVEVEGLSGAATLDSARFLARQFQAIEGSFGDAVFTQAGGQVTWEKAQVRNMLASPVNARLASASFDFAYAVRVSFSLVLNQ